MLTVGWFMRRGNYWWLGWSRITPKHTPFRWKTKWQLEHLGALGIMDDTASLRDSQNNPFSAIDGLVSLDTFHSIRLIFCQTAILVHTCLTVSPSPSQMALTSVALMFPDAGPPILARSADTFIHICTKHEEPLVAYSRWISSKSAITYLVFIFSPQKQ